MISPLHSASLSYAHRSGDALRRGPSGSPRGVVRGLGRFETPQRALGTFARSKVPSVPDCSPGRPFLLYRQRHVLFSAGRKENVGLRRWVLTDTPCWLSGTTAAAGRCAIPAQEPPAAVYTEACLWALGTFARSKVPSGPTPNKKASPKGCFFPRPGAACRHGPAAPERGRLS